MLLSGSHNKKVRYQGFQMQRLWPRGKKEPAGWLLRLGQEPIMLSLEKGGWRFKPCDQPLSFDPHGRVQPGPIDQDFHRLIPLIQPQAFPSRYQALQAARGLLLSQTQRS